MGEAMITRRGGGGLKIDGLLDEYVVSSGSVSAGDFVKWVFEIKSLGATGEVTNTNKFSQISAAEVDDSHAIIVYQSYTPNVYPTACIVAFTESGAAAGTATQIGPTGTDTDGGTNVCVYSIGDNQFLVFSLKDSSSTWYAGKLTVDNDYTITVNNQMALQSAIDSRIKHIWRIDGNKFGGIYYASSYLNISVLEWENNKITARKGSKYYAYYGMTEDAIANGFTPITGEKYACITSEETSDRMFLTYFTDTGTTVTLDTPTSVSSSGGAGLGVLKLPNGKYLLPCSAQVSGVNIYLGVRLITVTSNAITMGTVTQITTTAMNSGQRASQIHMANLPGGRVILVRNYDATGAYKANYLIIEILGNTVTTLTDSVQISGPDATNLSFTRGSVVGVGNSVAMFYSAGTTRIIQILGGSNGIVKCSTGEYVGGLAAEDGAANDTIQVYHPA